MKVINLYGGPGAGKSTVAAGLFSKMKVRGLNVALATEFAKDLVWEDRLGSDKIDQGYIFAQQNRRLHRLRDQVDFVITDSPLLLNVVYGDTAPDYWSDFVRYVIAVNRSYDNIDFLIRRDTSVSYKQTGRSQTLTEALVLDIQIANKLDVLTQYTTVENSADAVLGMLTRLGHIKL